MEMWSVPVFTSNQKNQKYEHARQLQDTSQESDPWWEEWVPLRARHWEDRHVKKGSHIGTLLH